MVDWIAGNEPTLEASDVFGQAFAHSVPREMVQRLRRRPLSGELCAFRAAGNEPTLEASAVFERAFVHSVPREILKRLRRRYNLPGLGLDLRVPKDLGIWFWCNSQNSSSFVRIY